MRHASVAAELESQFGRPDPDDWTEQYAPDEVDAYRAELADLEDQLDLHWAGWRERKPFHTLRHEKVAWIKVRLLRRDLILTGRGDHGVLLTRRVRDGFPIAIPVRPSRAATDRSAYRPIVCTPLLADRLRMPLAQVEELLQRMPDGVRDVRSWLVGERERAAEAPSPPAPAPLPDQPLTFGDLDGATVHLGDGVSRRVRVAR
jgi:hypothetical protein